MSLRIISIKCPTCLKICEVIPCEYEPSVGEFECESCGCMGTAETGIEDELEEKLRKVKAR